MVKGLDSRGSKYAVKDGLWEGAVYGLAVGHYRGVGPMTPNPDARPAYEKKKF